MYDPKIFEGCFTGNSYCNIIYQFCFHLLGDIFSQWLSRTCSVCRRHRSCRVSFPSVREVLFETVLFKSYLLYIRSILQAVVLPACFVHGIREVSFYIFVSVHFQTISLLHVHFTATSMLFIQYVRFYLLSPCQRYSN